MFAKLMTLLVPPLCIACGADAGRAAPLCRECRAQMQPRGSAAAAYPSNAYAAGAGSASAGSAPCWAPFPYDGPAGALVRALKFGGRAGVADVMAAQIAAHAPPGLLRGAIVPVPVHPQHRRRRGIDHAAALGRALARRARLPYSVCLIRSGDAKPQVGRGRRDRVRGVAGSVSVCPDLPVPREALLVDDVVTTGATLAACMSALADAGSELITPIAYARTSGR